MPKIKNMLKLYPITLLESVSHAQLNGKQLEKQRER